MRDMDFEKTALFDKMLRTWIGWLYEQPPFFKEFIRQEMGTRLHMNVDEGDIFRFFKIMASRATRSGIIPSNNYIDTNRQGQYTHTKPTAVTIENMERPAP